MGINEEGVRWAYRLFLDREAESDFVVREKVDAFSTTQELRATFMNSQEFLRNADENANPAEGQSPYFHYATEFDPIALMRRHAVKNLQPLDGYLTNFLGVRIDPKYFPSLPFLADRKGQVEDIPIPANWHADIAEWGTALRAIELSGGGFTMIELGCGWGCWMNNAGVAAKATGRTVKVIGIEGDGDHIQFAREALAINGFADGEIELHRGVASAREGTALFPRYDVPGISWGSEPIFNATAAQCAQAQASGEFEALRMIPLAEVASGHARIDLLHIDIQGSEADLIDGCLELLNEKVAYMLIGTHSKPIEGRLYQTLLDAGWYLEMERAAIFGLTGGKPQTRVDGVQGWRNPKLLPL